jgi:hypothetical protein
MSLEQELQRQLDELRPRYDRLHNLVTGIASCATRCGCCETHRELCIKALGELATERKCHDSF